MDQEQKVNVAIAILWGLFASIVVIWLAMVVSVAVNAQEHEHDFPTFTPRGGFSHVPEGMRDPYPHECCHGRDCSPWPVEDVVPRGDGTYYIPSLEVTVNKGRVRPLTKEMSQLAIALNGEASPYHLCIRRDPATGAVVMPVTVHCFFAGDGM